MRVTTTEFLLMVIAFILFWMLIIYIRNSGKQIKNMEGNKPRKQEHKGERFLVDEEHDLVLDTKTGRTMTIFEYNSLLVASTEESEEDTEE